MKSLTFCAFAPFALAACSAESTGAYDMTADAARGKLLSAKFDRGILPGSSGLKPRVQKSYEGELEWHVLAADDRNGWWCPLAIESASEGGKKVRVVNQCEGMLASKNNQQLDELVDATLSGRAPTFD